VLIVHIYNNNKKKEANDADMKRVFTQ